jgi:hypothetical protein
MPSVRRLLPVLLLLVALSAGAKDLSLVAGGDRIFDNDPSTAANNCLGWSFGASPVVNDEGNVVAMYTASDVLTNRCKESADPAEKFGDRIRYHVRSEEGTWTGGIDVIDRSHFSWMQDPEFLAANPASFVGHLASPSVVKADGRYYMAFVGSVDDRNLCAGEHFATNICGSCFDPWSYFVVMWAVSDDGVNWRVRERARGDAMLIGRPPDASERGTSSIYKGLTRVALVAHEEKGISYFYFGTQYWTRDGIKMGMFRIERDPASEWGLTGDPELWSTTRRWVTCTDGRVPDFLSSTNEYSMTGMNEALSSIVRDGERYMAFATHTGFEVAGRSRFSQVSYFVSTNLLQWNGPFTIPSAIPYVADGYGYEVSVIDPIAVPDGPERMRLFYSSADGDARNGVARDGRHDCQLDPRAGPTAPYMGTGIHEATLEYIDRRHTSTTITASNSAAVGDTIRAVVQVASEDGSAPHGTVIVTDNRTIFEQVRVVNGEAVLALPIRGEAGARTIYAQFTADGIWASSRSEVLELRVVKQARKRGVRR